MTTVEDLMERTQANLALLAGQGAQLYAQNTIVEKLRLAHNSYLGMKWWDQCMNWTSSPLDGATGVVTANLSVLDPPLSQYIDIQHVMCEYDRRPLPRLPDTVIPSLVEGNNPRFIMPYSLAAKLFKVVPYTAVDTVYIRYRTRPATWGLETNVLIDDDLLIRAATFQYLVDDGTNPDATNVAAQALKDRWVEVENEHNRVLPLNEYEEPGGLFTWR